MWPFILASQTLYTLFSVTLFWLDLPPPFPLPKHSVGNKRRGVSIRFSLIVDFHFTHECVSHSSGSINYAILLLLINQLSDCFEGIKSGNYCVRCFMAFDSQTVFCVTAGIPKSEHNYKFSQLLKKISVADPMLRTG